MLAHRWTHLDLLGGTLSIACAVHCAASPLLVAAMPALAGEAVEMWLGWSLLLLATLSVVGGSFLHGSTRALVPLVLAVGLFVGRRFVTEEGSPAELALVIAASGLFITAHTLNYRACRCC